MSSSMIKDHATRSAIQDLERAIKRIESIPQMQKIDHVTGNTIADINGVIDKINYSVDIINAMTGRMKR